MRSQCIYSPSGYYHQFLRVRVLSSSSKPRPLRTSVLISIVFSAIAFFAVLVVLFFIFWYLKLLKQSSRNKTNPEDGSCLKIHRFKYKELKRATKCFSQSQKLGKGGFGVVYRGLLGDGRVVAVKKLDLSSLQGEREFQNELSICSKLNSPHVVSLLGYSTHGKKERLLVYEVMQNRSLQEALFEKGYHTFLDWDKRFKIIFDIAKSLEFLHSHCKPTIIHGDIKPSNVLLDNHFSAKIADFGLARFKVDDLGFDIARFSYAEQAKAEMSDKLRVRSSENTAPGSPEMNRSPTFRLSFSNYSYRATMESPSVTHKLLPKEAVTISVEALSGEAENVMDATAAFCTSPSLVQTTQGQIYAHEVEAGLEGGNFGKNIPSRDASDMWKNSHGHGASDSCQLSKSICLELCSSDSSLLPVKRQLSTKVRVSDSSFRQEARSEMAGEDYVVDWLGSEHGGNYNKQEELEIVSVHEKAIGGGKEQKDIPRPHELSAKKETRKVRPVSQRKSREWWKDEYFAELKSKNKANQECRRKRKKTTSVDNWKDFLSGELHSSSDELRKSDYRGMKEVGRSDWLHKARSGDLSWCRRDRRARTPSMPNDGMCSGDLNGQLNNEGFYHQWSGNLSKSGELASRDVSSTTSMRGTVCYVAPEYGGHGVLSEKSDVYSFGVLMLVILSGRRPIQVAALPMKEFERANLISWARCLAQSGRLLDLMDEGLQGEYNHEHATMCIMVALLCLQRVPTSRPDISDVVKILLGELTLPPLPLSLSSPPAPLRTHYRLPLHSSKALTVTP